MKKLYAIAKSLILAIMLLMLTTSCTKKSAATEKNRLDDILARGYIEVATEPYFAPNEFIDPSKTGDEQYVGSDIEFAKYIAKELGVELRIVPLEFTAVLAGVSEGKYDLAISALAYTSARTEAMNLSDGYFFSVNDGHGLLIRTDDSDKIKTPADLADKTVVVQSGSLQELFVTDQIPKYKELKKVSSTMDGYLMVEEDKADVSITSISLADLYLEANQDSGLMVVDGFKFEQDASTDGTRVGIPKGETELTDKINELIKKVLESGQYEKWHEEYKEYAKKLGL